VRSALMTACLATAAVLLAAPDARAACSCAGRECGNDGCGASCGTCAAGKGCDPAAGKCVSPAACCAPGAVDDPAIAACDCYACVCMYSPECCDAGGAWSAACASVCVQCGGSCPCEFDCKGRECGDDGCGGTCGTCTGGEACVAGTCRGEYPERCVGDAEPSAESCYAGLTAEGCCDAGGHAVWCGPDGKLYCGDCGADGACTTVPGVGATCGPAGSPAGAGCAGGPCVGKCKGLNCGDDGCGGVCGTCAEGEVCKEGKCWCVPDCKDKECGPAAACGGTCGYCKGGKVCQGYKCVDPFAEPAGDAAAADAAADVAERDASADPGGEGSSGCAAGAPTAATWMVLAMALGLPARRRGARLSDGGAR
jgi:hypothetical protein